MKRMIFILILFVVQFAYAVDFVIPEVQNAFDLRKKVATATWDFSTQGGAVGAIDLGIDLPANTLVNFAYFYTVTQPVSAGSGTGALSCEDANNLYSAADVTGNSATDVVLGVPQNAAANMVKNIAAACNLTWTIASSPYTAGKLIFFVEYTVIE